MRLDCTNLLTQQTNFAAWAAQGYVVVLPNVTGSGGYGLDFVRRTSADVHLPKMLVRCYSSNAAIGIQNMRGERPFQDLLALIDYLQGIPYIDNGKGTIVGSSSSAYLVNKVLGHEAAKKVSRKVDEMMRPGTDLRI